MPSTGAVASPAGSVAAGLATIAHLTPELYAKLEKLGAELEVGLKEAAKAKGVPATVQRVGSMITLFFHEGPVRSWDDADGARWSVNAFFAFMLSVEGLAIGVFAATDVFLFYVLFEATLIPIYFLIGEFGGAQRSYAAVKFLLYSLLGGLLMLASVIGLYVVSSKTAAGPTRTVSFSRPVEKTYSVSTPALSASSCSRRTTAAVRSTMNVGLATMAR